MENPLVSVCIICYNQEQYIADCLNSIVRQNCNFQYEIVVGDDCSTDGTREIIEDFQKRYPALVRYLPSEKNLGIVPNFLRTAKACIGEFIAFCEGDDYWIDDNKLTIQKDVLTSNPTIDLVFHPAIGRSSLYSYGDSLLGFLGTRCLVVPIDEVIIGRGGLIPSASILFRQTIVSSIPEWFKDMPGCDYHLKVLAAARGGAYYLPYVMSTYRKYSHGSWSSRFSKDADLALGATIKAIDDSFRLEALLNFEGSIKCFRDLRMSYLFQIAETTIIIRKDRLRSIIRNSHIVDLGGLMVAIISVILNSKLPSKGYNGVKNLPRRISKKFYQLSFFE